MILKCVQRIVSPAYGTKRRKYLPMGNLEFAPWVAAALGLGRLLAVVYAFTVAISLRGTSTQARTLFFGDHKLTANESSRSLFATWMSVGNVIVGALGSV